MDTDVLSPRVDAPRPVDTRPMLPPATFETMKNQLAKELLIRDAEMQREFGPRVQAPQRQPGDRMLDEVSAKVEASRILERMLSAVGYRSPRS